MSEVQRIGPVPGTMGNPVPFTAGVTGASRTGDAHARYLEATLANRAYFLSVAAAAPTAYVGAAGGTPLIGVHNPANSSKILVGHFVGFAGRAAASAAGQTGLVLWAGPSVPPTGTVTAPTNNGSQAKAGSAMVGFVNTAMTGSAALSLALPLFTHYWATAAGAISSPGLLELAGITVIYPGNQIALGLTVAPTGLTCDVSFFWEEIPYIVLAT